MTKINELVNNAVMQWTALMGLQFDKKGKVTDSDNGVWSTWDLRNHLEGLNESRTLDPSGLTTFMMLRGLVEHYLKNVSFDAYSLILNPDSVEKQLAVMRALRDILEHSEVVDLILEFENRLRKAISHYGVTDSTLHEELLNDKYELAYLRRDALLSIERMEKHQFVQGEKDPNPLKYNPQIFEFWNINSLLSAMQTQKVSGISLCLIRDPEEVLHSYFVFAIRNGETLTILTDRPDDPHPDFKHMSRRPDRNLERRAERNWFPYQLLDLEKSEDGKRLYAKERTQLVPINTVAVSLAEISSLTPEQFFWTLLMFDLIMDKFWKGDIKLPELSYTGEMVIESTTGLSLVVRNKDYKPLEMSPLTRNDVTAKATADQWERKPRGHNRWLVKRYGNQVPEEMFNLVGEQAALLLEEFFTASSPVKDTASFLVKDTFSSLGNFKVLEPTNFGTKDRLQKDRLWAARVNQMKVIQHLADREYEQTVAQVKAWYEEKLIANKEFLLNCVAQEKLLVPSWKPSKPEPFSSHWTDGSQGNLVRLSNEIFYYQAQVRFGTRVGEEVYCCERPNKRAYVYTKIQPVNAETIALLCGVSRTELPWQLQNWRDQDPYRGNSILNRLDPEDWVLDSPWKKLSLSIVFAHSRLALNARKKALALKE